MSKDKKTLLSGMTTRNLVILGLLLILASNLFSAQVLNLKLHEMLANIGALLLIVGTLQWYFDEDSRSELVDKLIESIRGYLDRRDRLASDGVADCVMDSKVLAGHEITERLIKSDKLAIGIHYSDGTIARFEKAIRERLAQQKTTQIFHSQRQGIAAQYLEQSITPQIVLATKIDRLLLLVNDKFPDHNGLIRLVEHQRVLHYSFIYSDYSIWIIFMTSTDHYVSNIPAMCVSAGSPLFDFFKDDIKRLGVLV